MTTAREYSQFGDLALIRYFGSDGHQQMTLPMRVIEDRDDRVVAWLAPDSEITYWTTLDGREPRSYPLDQMFEHTLVAKRRRWEGRGILRVLLPEVPYSIIHFWNDDGSFRGWYVNFERPHVRQGTTFDSIDWHLDLWLYPDGTHEWKDEDEAHAAVTAGVLLSEQFSLARVTGDTLVDDSTALMERIGDWSTFVPPPEWSPLNLPLAWDHPTEATLFP